LFWRQARASRPVLRGRTFEVVEPVGVVDRDVLSALYFRYLPRLDGEIKVLRREFRGNVQVVAAAVAELNGRNLVASMSPPLSRGNPFSAVRPSRDDLQRRLDTTRKTARGLQRSWDEAHRGWLAVRRAYERLLQCLCHRDVSPGNSVHVDATIRFADFGLAGVGRVGSDLHTLIRWSGKAMADDDHVEDLIKTYLDGLKPYVPAVTLNEVRLAAWAAFFLRYTNLKFSSARYLRTYDLAVRKMREMVSLV
jgi:Ser/Thr protein kinase RdoA (MazF antagonist)